MRKTAELSGILIFQQKARPAAMEGHADERRQSLTNRVKMLRYAALILEQANSEVFAWVNF